MDLSTLPVWIGSFIALIAALMGGATYIHTQDDKIKKQLRDDLAAQKKEFHDIRKEDAERVTREIQRVEKALEDEKDERKRETDRMEKTLEGFADVAAAVIAMGKSVEYLTERFTEHKKTQEDSMRELKASIRSVEQQIVMLGVTQTEKKS